MLIGACNPMLCPIHVFFLLLFPGTIRRSPSGRARATTLYGNFDIMGCKQKTVPRNFQHIATPQTPQTGGLYMIPMTVWCLSVPYDPMMCVPPPRAIDGAHLGVHQPARGRLRKFCDAGTGPRSALRRRRQGRAQGYSYNDAILDSTPVHPAPPVAPWMVWPSWHMSASLADRCVWTDFMPL